MFCAICPSLAIYPTISYPRSVDSFLSTVRVRTVSVDSHSFDWADDVEDHLEDESRRRGRSDVKKPLRFLFPTAREPNPDPCIQAIFRRSSAPAYMSTEAYKTLDTDCSARPMSSSSFSSISTSVSSSTGALLGEEDEWDEAPEKEEARWTEHTVSILNLDSESNLTQVKEVLIGSNDDHKHDLTMEENREAMFWARTDARARAEVIEGESAEEWERKTLWQR